MAALDQVEANRNVRCLIITATGPTFSAGYDIGKLALGGDNDEMFGLCDRVENLVQPTICALNGNVYGGATDLALACDIRLGIEGMKMFMPPAKLGCITTTAGSAATFNSSALGTRSASS